MQRFDLAELSFQVEHGPGPEETRLGVEARDGRRLLDVRCTYTEGSCEVDPDGERRQLPAPAGRDPLDWILDLVAGGAAELVAGIAGAAPYPASATLPLSDLEAALRNPPVDFDGVTAESKRPSHGEKWSAYPEDVLPLWVADMDFALAEPIRRVLARAIRRSDVGYPIHPAPTEVRPLSVARMQERYGWSLEPSRIEILTDVVQGMEVAVQQLTEPGDGVVVQTPIYPPFLACAERAGRRRIEVPLEETELHYRVDPDAIASALDDRTRVLLLCNPHNPTGRALSRDELLGIGRLAIERDLVIVSDEIHADLVYPGARHIPIASLSPEIEARTITLTSASKAFNLAGLRCAVAIFGSDELARAFRSLSRHVGGGIGVPGIEALQVAWRHGGTWQSQVLEYLRSNRDFVVERVRAELPGIRVEPPEATYLAWLDCRALELEPTPYEFFLERARVALSAGTAFGSVGEGFVRLNFATSRGILSEALERMAKALRA